MEQSSSSALGRDLAQMLKGGVIMDVVTPEQAKIAEEAGACAVMALERVPADIRRDGGVARMSDPALITAIKNAVSIPVMAKVRIGHAAEARIVESLAVDFIDESEVLTPADPFDHIDKRGFTVPFVCGARDLGEALRRIQEGAAMIRTKGEAGTGNIIEAVRHWKCIRAAIQELKTADEHAVAQRADAWHVPQDLVRQVRTLQRLPVVTFVAGGVATPADAALMMMLGAEGVFVGSGIFHAQHPEKTAAAMVEAVVHWSDPKILARVSSGLGLPMRGQDIDSLGERMQERGW